MMVKRAVIDTNILVYAMLEDHPAYHDCYNFLLEAETNFTLYSSVETLFEIYRILRVFYQLDPRAAIEKVVQLESSSILFLETQSKSVRDILESIQQKLIHANDGRLLAIARETASEAIITDDRHFGKVIQELNLKWVTPIQDSTRMEMDAWEQMNLPPKGLPRILASIFNYLQQIAPEVARKFHSDTRNFTSLPEIL